MLTHIHTYTDERGLPISSSMSLNLGSGELKKKSTGPLIMPPRPQSAGGIERSGCPCVRTSICP